MPSFFSSLKLFLHFHFITPFYFQPVTGTEALMFRGTEKPSFEGYCSFCSNKATSKTVRHVFGFRGHSVTQQLSHDCHIKAKINLYYNQELTELLRLYKITLSVSNISLPLQRGSLYTRNCRNEKERGTYCALSCNPDYYLIIFTITKNKEEIPR